MRLRGYCGIGIWNPLRDTNVGTLWRTASIFHADFLFTVGNRYTHQSSDTPKSPKHTSLFHYTNLQDFLMHLPDESTLVGIELVDGAKDLRTYDHPESAVYLLGSESTGIPKEALEACKEIIRLPGSFSMNVATAGSIVLYDRYTKNA